MSFLINTVQLITALIVAFFYGWGCRIAYTEWVHNKSLRCSEREIAELCKMTVLADKWLKKPVYGAKRVEGRWFVRLDENHPDYVSLSGLLGGES